MAHYVPVCFPLLSCRTAVSNPLTGNANAAVTAAAPGDILPFYVIGNEAGWFPEIQVRVLVAVQKGSESSLVHV